MIKKGYILRFHVFPESSDPLSKKKILQDVIKKIGSFSRIWIVFKAVFIFLFSQKNSAKSRPIFPVFGYYLWTL